MNYETMERCGRTYAVKNGVESEYFTIPGAGDCWLIYRPIRHGFASSSLTGALTVIADRMGAWYTVTEAATRLVELGKADKPPAVQTMYRWLRRGRFPGAIKVRTVVGRGGSWRIPEAALREFTRGDEKK